MAGNGHQRTDLATAARAVAMYQAGIPVREISKETDLSKRTIYNILSGEHNWDEIIRNDERYKLYKDATTRGLEVNCWELAKKSFIHAEEKLPEASYAQGGFGGATLIDKARLLAGEATEIHEVFTKEKWDRLNSDRAMLLQEIERRISVAKAEEAAIVVEVEKELDSEGSPKDETL